MLQEELDRLETPEEKVELLDKLLAFKPDDWIENPYWCEKAFSDYTEKLKEILKVRA